MQEHSQAWLDYMQQQNIEWATPEHWLDFMDQHEVTQFNEMWEQEIPDSFGG